MKTVFAVVCGFLAFVMLLVGFAALGFFGNYYNLAMYQYFAPRRMAVQRQVFENTPSYQLGNVQTLRDLQAQYITADKSGKEALGAVVLHEAGNVANENTLPLDVQEFLAQVRKDRAADY